MDITEKILITEAQKLNEKSPRVKLLMFVATNAFVGPVVALGLGYLLVSGMGFVLELIFKDPSYKTQAIIYNMLFTLAASYAVILQILIKKLIK